MTDRSADAFLYAKASGMLAKSFVGSRMASLFSATSLEGLWELLFRSEVPLVPDFVLVQMIERRAEKRFLEGFLSLVSKYIKPEGFFVDLLHFYDYNNLKTILASLGSAETSGEFLSELPSLGRYSMLNYAGWPSLESMTARTPVSWCAEALESMDMQDIRSRLDSQYVRSLWDGASRLKGETGVLVKKLLKEELVLNNIVWGLRLRSYYGMGRDDALEQLVATTDCKSVEALYRNELTKPAAQVLSLPLDSYRDWENWKYSHLLNPQEEGVEWSVDPRWIQRTARFELYKRALRQFHQHPFTAHVIYCWFKVKQYELDCIRMVAEGIRLKVSPAQVGKFAGIEVV